MRLVLITAVWQRHAITRAFWLWTRYLRGWWSGIDLKIVVAGSQDPEHQKMAQQAGVDVYLDVPNETLGRKFNYALAMARAFRPDGVIRMDSDDVFCERVAAAYLPYLAAATPYVGLKDLYFYDTGDGRATYWPGYTTKPRRGEPMGCGRVIPRAFLEECNWKLWDDERHRPMDHESFTRLLSLGVGHPPLIGVRELHGCAIDLKSAENLWPLSELALPATEVDIDAVLGKLPGPVREAIPRPRVVLLQAEAIERKLVMAARHEFGPTLRPEPWERGVA